MWRLGPLYIWFSGDGAESLESEDADDKGFGRRSKKSSSKVHGTAEETTTSRKLQIGIVF
jgi:hypothetical protein